jgi:NTP pyrophosphatase (non-canonical NTP hydrolase)
LLKKEIGDTFWYIAAICSELGFEMNDVAESNIKKLKDRQNRNVLKGSGDNR